MAGLVPAIHVVPRGTKGVDARVKPGHDVPHEGRAKWRERVGPHPTSTASAASTLSALSVTVFSKDGACTAKVSAKKRARAT